jgi:hypothetical protein
MAFILEIKMDNVKHHLVMPDMDTAKCWLAKLEPHVGVRFKNRETEQMRIPSVEGEAVISLEHIISARAIDGKIYQDAVSEERIAERTEFANIFRKVDSEIWEKILERLESKKE